MNVQNLSGEGGCYVYTYFPLKRYMQQVVVQDEDYDIWTLEWKKQDFIERYYSTVKPSESVTIGYYERR